LIETDSYLAHVSGYIHANPENSFDYEFSSLRDYCRGRESGLVSKDLVLSYFNNSISDYEKYVHFCETKNMSKAAFDMF